MKKLPYYILCLHALFLFGIAGPALGEEQIIYCRSPESGTDNRLNFVKEIIIAVLDRTVEEYGPYRIKPIPRMVFSRISQAETQKNYPNLVIRLSGDTKSTEPFEVVPIPINRGIVGYRLCLIHESRQQDFNKISTISDLQEMRLKAGQGRWTDADILRENGIKVVEGTDYEGLFHMLMSSRFDFFPRGVNEAFEELETRRTTFPKMQVEKTIAFYYPLPRVLVTNKGNTALAERVAKGLKAIFADGTHRVIWLKYNRKWVLKAELEKRKVFVLKNPFALPDLPYNQKEYWYQPGENL